MALAAPACSLLSSTDGFTGGVRGEAGAAGQGPMAGGAAGGGASGAGGSPAGGSAGSPAGGGGSGPLAAGPGLEANGSIGTGVVSFSVANRFELVFRKSDAAWQWAQWHDGDDLSVDLGGEDMIDPWVILLAESHLSVDQATNQTAELVSSNRARSVLTTTFEMTNGGALNATLQASVRYAIFASGRIAVSAIVKNPSAGTLPITGYFEYGHLRVAPDLAWSTGVPGGGMIDPSQPYFFFRRTDSPANALVVRVGSASDRNEANNEHNSYFTVEPHPEEMASGASVSRTWDIRVWPSGLSADDLGARARDVRSSAIEASSSVDAAAYDAAEGAYVATATAGTASLRLAPGEGRFDPTFVLKNWPSEHVTVRRNGIVLATDAAPQTTHAALAYDAATKELVVSTYEAIEAGAPEGERTFTFEP